MFDFIDMLDTYDQRKIDRYEEGDLIVDTCTVIDADQPYETAVAHPNYNDGDWIIVELYGTEEEARAGHKR